MTRGTRPELARGATHPSGSDGTGDDVVMEAENEGERSAGDSNPSGPDSRRRITTKREPREARDEQSTVTSLLVPRRMSGKTSPQAHAVAVTTQEASDGSRENFRVANIENSLGWVSISSAGALAMTHCDFSERLARDEMRHIIGSSEPGVIIGFDKEITRDVRERTRTTLNFCVNCTEH